MHKIFRKALDNAIGDTHSVIAVIIDIRDFSPFSLEHDSYEIAMFLKRVYMNIIDKYFNFASFYKSTGDGLLLTIPFDASNPEEVTQKTITNCIDCHRDFGNICSDDHLINFRVPNRIGIGVGRGAACCLISGKKIIDYSGRLINLTSRLTALARPSGIVIDQSLGINLLDENTRKNFKREYVYLDGIAEFTPITVYCTKKFTKIPKRNKQVIAYKKWKHTKDSKKLRDIAKFGNFRYSLLSEPTSAKDIDITITLPKITKGKFEGGYKVLLTHFPDFKYKLEAGSPVVWLNFPKLYEKAKRHHVNEDMNVYIDIAYVEK